MTKKKIRADVAAVAKVEATAKAEFKRKKIIKEAIPEDVTRSRANAWLDVLSPITEWAGLKGDALKFQRQQLRIQQEETLLEIANRVRQKIAGKAISGPVPAKILVPALEKASLEEADDDSMIEIWANLLASAATGRQIEPRYVGIIAELSSNQAKLLSALARYRLEEAGAPYSCFWYSWQDMSEESVKTDIKHLVEKLDVSMDAEELALKARDWIGRFSGPGVYIEAFMLNDFEYNMDGREGLGVEQKDLLILESLGLAASLTVHFFYEESGFSGFLIYYYITGLGVDFVSVCEPDLIAQMERQEELFSKRRPG